MVITVSGQITLLDYVALTINYTKQTNVEGVGLDNENPNWQSFLLDNIKIRISTMSTSNFFRLTVSGL